MYLSFINLSRSKEDRLDANYSTSYNLKIRLKKKSKHYFFSQSTYFVFANI